MIIKLRHWGLFIAFGGAILLFLADPSMWIVADNQPPPAPIKPTKQVILNPDVVMVGDSLTQWTNWSDLVPGKKVRNDGIAGNETSNVLTRIDLIKDSNACAVFLLIGTNDVLRNRDPAQILGNEERIINILVATRPKVVVQAIPYLGSRFTGYVQKNEEIRELNRQIQRLARSKNTQFLQLNDILLPIDETRTTDGIHFNKQGYTLWAFEVQRMLLHLKCSAPKTGSRPDGHRAEQ